MSIFRQNFHKMIPCEHLTDVLYNVFFKVAFTQIFKHQTKTLIFETIVKLINIYWGFKFQKGDIKIDFKEELLQNT